MHACSPCIHDSMHAALYAWQAGTAGFWKGLFFWKAAMCRGTYAMCAAGL
jgi:hypothetical protein